LYCFFTYNFCSGKNTNANRSKSNLEYKFNFFIPSLPEGGGGILFYLCPSVLPSVQDIFRRIFLSNSWWQKSDIWSQVSYRYTIVWVAFLDPSDSYFLFANLVGFYTHWTYMHIFCHIFLSNYWWQRSDMWSQASYRYPISWEVFLTRQIPTSCLPKSRGIISEH
jgi:hypothetical protein